MRAGSAQLCPPRNDEIERAGIALRTGVTAVIRQAISCDVCGAEKKQTNHWYVACELAGELRVGGWNSRMRTRAGAKHLCGQKCLHKLVDEFLARIAEGRSSSASIESTEETITRNGVDASLTSAAAYNDVASSARLIAPVASDLQVATPLTYHAVSTTNIIPLEGRTAANPLAPVGPLLEDVADFSSRRWRAEAWERERNRELRAVEQRPEIVRRRQGA
ncbi:MAG TPA: hypothetical protein VGJ21_21840 [Terracidiphilus sp.]|jgi:hypothetical protein